MTPTLVPWGLKFFLFSVLGLLICQAQAGTVRLVANGSDNLVDAVFWQVVYQDDGNPSPNIVSIQINVGAVAPAVHFDFDGIGTYVCNPDCLVNNSGIWSVDLSSEGPVIAASSGIGGVSFQWPVVDNTPEVLTVNTAAFGLGGSLTFAANTNGVTDGIEGGYESGDLLAGTEFTVYFSDGSIATGVLQANCGTTCSSGVVTTSLNQAGNVQLIANGSDNSIDADFW